jgi:hypothetical protein
MIRLLFVLFVTLGGFAAAAIWNFRGGDVAEQIISPQLKNSLAAEIERLEIPKLAEKLPIPKPKVATTPVDSKPAAKPASAKSPQRALPATVAVSAAKAAAATTPRLTNAPQDSNEPAHSGAGGSATVSDTGADLVAEVVELEPRAEFARDFGPASEHGVEIASDALPVDSDSASARPDWDDSPNHDADRSAKLIRRMLAVYRSRGSGR